MSETLRDAIADLVHRYSDAITRRDLDQWASCWARDGRWEIRDDRIARTPDERLGLLSHAFGVLDGVVQMTMNGTVTPDGDDAARGRWYIVEHTRRLTGERGVLLAHYDDRYVREAGRWAFAARTLVRHYDGPSDLTSPFT